MQTLTSTDTDREQSLAHVFLIEPNAALRSAIQAVLSAERYQVEACQSLTDVLDRASGGQRVVTLVAWQSMHRQKRRGCCPYGAKTKVSSLGREAELAS